MIWATIKRSYFRGLRFFYAFSASSTLILPLPAFPPGSPAGDLYRGYLPQLQPVCLLCTFGFFRGKREDLPAPPLNRRLEPSQIDNPGTSSLSSRFFSNDLFTSRHSSKSSSTFPTAAVPLGRPHARRLALRYFSSCLFASPFLPLYFSNSAHS